MLKQARKYQDLAVEGKKAQQYDAFSRTYRMRDFQENAALAATYLRPGSAVLEVATGPGYFCIELAKLGDFRITGLDISDDLVKIARSNAAAAGVKAEFVQGNASALQFPDASFDLVFCSWAVKNFREPVKALVEMHRVLAPGGKALIVDLNHDVSSDDWKRYAANRGLRGMTGLAMRLAFTIQRRGAYSRGDFERMLAETPFQRCEIGTKGIDLCLTLTK